MSSRRRFRRKQPSDVFRLPDLDSVRAVLRQTSPADAPKVVAFVRRQGPVEVRVLSRAALEQIPGVELPPPRPGAVLLGVPTDGEFGAFEYVGLADADRSE